MSRRSWRADSSPSGLYRHERRAMNLKSLYYCLCKFRLVQAAQSRPRASAEPANLADSLPSERHWTLAMLGAKKLWMKKCLVCLWSASGVLAGGALLVRPRGDSRCGLRRKDEEAHDSSDSRSPIVSTFAWLSMKKNLSLGPYIIHAEPANHQCF